MTWPRLAGLIGGSLHQDAIADHGTYEAAIMDQLVAYRPAELSAVISEWRDWNGKPGQAGDIRPALAALGMSDRFGNPIEARIFMDWIHDEIAARLANPT